MVQTVEQALREIREQHNLTRLDIGIADWREGYHATVWYDVPEAHPENFHGCSFGDAGTMDGAVKAALADMRDKLAVCANFTVAEAA